MPEEKVVLYLEPWQKNMMADFATGLRKKIFTKVIIDITKIKQGGCLRSYKIPPMGMKPGDWLLYLSDVQSLQLKEQLKLRTPVPSMNVTADAVKSGAIAFV